LRLGGVQKLLQFSHWPVEEKLGDLVAMAVLRHNVHKSMVEVI
jgi:hypothetical protein